MKSSLFLWPDYRILKSALGNETGYLVVTTSEGSALPRHSTRVSLGDSVSANFTEMSDCFHQPRLRVLTIMPFLAMRSKNELVGIPSRNLRSFDDLGLYYFVRCFDVSVLIFHFITCLSRFNAKNTKPELQEDWNELADSLKDTLFDLPQESKHSLLKPW